IDILDGGTIASDSSPGFGAAAPIFQDLIEGGFVPALAPDAVARGRAGSIVIGDQTDRLRLDRGSIRTDALSLGDAGTISLYPRVLEASSGSQISSSSFQTGKAGSITIGPGTEVVHLSDSTLSTFAHIGPAVGQEREGNITLLASDSVLLEDGSTVTA